MKRALSILFLAVVLVCGGAGYSNAAGDQESALITFDFDNVELKAFIEAVSRITGKNIIFDPKIKGEVSVVSPVKISVEAAYSVFESVLQLHNLAAVPSGDVLKVIPLAEAKHEGIELQIGRSVPDAKAADRMITQVVRVSHMPVDEIKGLLFSMVSKYGHINYHTESNILIITDNTSNIVRLLKLIHYLDQPEPEPSFRSVHLTYADAAAVASKLESIFQENQQAGVSSARSPRFLVQNRINSLLILGNEEKLELIEKIVKEMDVPVPEDVRTTQVYYLDHADASKTAEILRGQLSAGEQTKSMTGGMKITADPSTNALIVTTPPENSRAVREIIDKLDIVRPQIYVESAIMEITMERMRQIGVEWRAVDKPVEDSIRPTGGTNFPLGSGDGIINTYASDPFSGPAGLVVGALKGTITFGGQEFLNIGALVQALQNDSEVNILSTPHLLTLDHEEAEIIVGEERPFLKSTQTTDIGSTIKTYEFKDIGITLRLTPHVSQGRFVRLQLFQEIKDFVRETDVGAVTSTKRQAKTTVVVGDGETVVIGGLIKDDVKNIRSQVPCLGAIPLLGRLFQAFQNDRKKTNLLIFITPHILRTSRELGEISGEKKMEFKEKSSSDFNDRSDGEPSDTDDGQNQE